jgi:adenylosuccinate synthase
MANVLLVAGLGYGDCGKGSIVDYLTYAHKAHTVVRYNGGAQAGHHVVSPTGTEHTFAQFGSGTFAGARTHLSRFMVVNPGALLNEAVHLAQLGIPDPFQGLTIDGEALVTTPFHQTINHLREIARADAPHGSCGMGVGETVRDALENPSEEIRVRHLFDKPMLRFKLKGVVERMRAIAESLTRGYLLQDIIDQTDTVLERFDEFTRRLGACVDRDYLSALLHRDMTIIFEGAQGVLLDEEFGWHPYTTWSDCTFGNAYKLIGNSDVKLTRIGVTRAYATRHGAGPLVTEDPTLDLPDTHNGDHPWQGRFRVGHFDLGAMSYAERALGGVDQIALTCLDRVKWPVKQCVGYEDDGGWIFTIPERGKSLEDREMETRRLMGARPQFDPDCDDEKTLISYIEHTFRARVTITSHGPTAIDKRTR